MNSSINESILQNNSQLHSLTYSEEDYSNYINQNDIVIEYYNKKKVEGFHKYFLQIDEFVNNEQKENIPLVIHGIGKRTLLVNWIQHHNLNNNNGKRNVIIPHFASAGNNNRDYAFSIYRILIKLREILDIKQKVELQEEKVRTYFEYWLNLSNEQIKRQILSINQSNCDKLILILEGIDNFIDNYTNQECVVSQWLPRYLPKNIRIICTTSIQSKSLKYFQQIMCQIIEIPLIQSILEEQSKLQETQELFINNETKNLHLEILQGISPDFKTNMFLNIFYSCFLPSPKDGYINKIEFDENKITSIFQNFSYRKIKQSENSEQLFQNILVQFEHNLMEKNKFIKLLYIFKIAQKGLTLEEIQMITNITQQEWKLFLVFFNNFLINYKNLWILNNECLKKCIGNYEYKDINNLHIEIAKTLEQITQNSIRKLEEQTYHLFMANKYFELKEIISAIENFLLLFNPINKYQLCRFWQTLEGKGFDPVIEYNKAIEGFEMHCHPKQEDIFKIIVQISRFLKEFSDFETFLTPNFRHPYISGNIEELNDIGILQELQRLKIFYPRQIDVQNFGDKKVQNNSEIYSSSNQNSILKQSKTIKQKIQQIMTKKPIQLEQFQRNSNLENNQQISIQKYSILNEIESLNIDIPVNRDLVRNRYREEIINILGKGNSKSQPPDEDQSGVIDPNLNLMLQQAEKIKEPKNQQMEDGVHLLKEYYMKIQKEPKNYYYKRWIWIQFPWVCMSLKCDYSEKLKQSSSSATQYMSVKDEKKFTKQALKIAIESKLKKQMIYQKKPTESIESIETPIIMKSQISLPKINNIRSSNDISKSMVRNNSVSNLKTKNNESSSNVFFFITEDQQLSFDNNEKIQNSLVDFSSQTTRQVLQQSKLIKEKVKFFNPIQSIHEKTEPRFVLPLLKKSITNHSSKEINILDKQSNDLSKNLNFIIGDNKRLFNFLKKLKLIENSHKKDIQGDQVISVQEKINELQGQLDSTTKIYNFSLLQTERMKKIKKICEENSNQNQEWIRKLNFLLNNLKKLIKFEQEEIKSYKDETQSIRKIRKSYQETTTEYIQNHYNLISQIKNNLNNKKKIDSIFLKSDFIIQESAQNQIEKMKKEFNEVNILKKQQEKQMNQENSKNTLKEDLQQMREKYMEISKLFDINNSNNEEYQQFLDNMQKKSKLNQTIIEKNDKINELLLILQDKESQLQVIKQAYGNQIQEQKVQNDETEEEIEQKNIDKLNDILDNKVYMMKKLEKIKAKCTLSIQTILFKLEQKQDMNSSDIFSFDAIKLEEGLKNKLDFIKNKLENNEQIKNIFNSKHEKINYEDFINQDYDHNQLLKQIIQSDKFDIKINHVKSQNEKKGKKN